MTPQIPFKRLILRAVLRNVSPMVIRIVALPDHLDLPDFDEVFRAILGWDGLGFIFCIHGQEFNSFRRRSKSMVTVASDFCASREKCRLKMSRNAPSSYG